MDWAKIPSLSWLFEITSTFVEIYAPLIFF
jgi:hypothetical protein